MTVVRLLPCPWFSGFVWRVRVWPWPDLSFRVLCHLNCALLWGGGEKVTNPGTVSGKVLALCALKVTDALPP